VQDFLVARYGAFVLLKPPFEWYTAMLWLTPAAALLAGAIAMFVAVRRRRLGGAGPAPLSPEEERRLSEMMDKSA
jgi:cytochrome c-type biogenesis protein CcmH